MRGRPGKLHGWGATASSPLGVHILGDLDMQQSDTGCLCISPGFASVVDSHTGCSVKSSCLAHAWVCYIKRIHIQCRNYWEPRRDGTAVALAAAELCFWRWQWKKYQMDTAEDRAVNAATARLVEVGNWFFFSVPWDKEDREEMKTVFNLYINGKEHSISNLLQKIPRQCYYVLHQLILVLCLKSF